MDCFSNESYNEQELMKKLQLEINKAMLPKMLFVHGIEDDTVPFTSTAEVTRLLRSCTGVQQCDEVYLGQTAHQDSVMHLMLGGATETVLLDWIKLLDDTKTMNTTDSNTTTDSSSRILIHSKL